MRIAAPESTTIEASQPLPASSAGLRHRLLVDLPQSGILQAWAATLFATFVGLRVLGHVERANVLWPVSGVAIAMVLPFWHLGWSKRLPLLLAATAGFWMTAVVLHMPWQVASMLAVLTGIDIVLGAWALSPTIKVFGDLKNHIQIFRFLLVVVLLPLITGSLGVFPVAPFLHQTVGKTLVMIFFGNSLGIATTLPAVLLFVSPDRTALLKLLHSKTQDKARIAGTILFFLAVVGFVFWQTTYPLLFMVFPPMILLIFATGLEGSVLAAVFLSIIGWIATSHGHGPILLGKGDPLQHLLTFQGFIWVFLAVALPVGALIDEHRSAELVARESASIYAVLLQHTEDCIILSSFDGEHRYVSPTVTRLTGWTEEEYLAMDRLQTFHPDDRETAKQLFKVLQTGTCDQSMRYRMLHKSGTWKWVQATFRPYGARGEAAAGYVKTIRDISLQMETEKSWQSERQGLLQKSRNLATMANTDPLTGLLNRRGFDESVDDLKQISRGSVSLLMIDIDFFKRFNDTYGHQVGDECLVKLAKILRKRASRSQDIVARFGGEEFTIVLFGTGHEGATRVAEAICADLRASAIQHTASPFGIATISIGTATDTGGAPLDVPQLIEQADQALYLSKQSRNMVTAYAP